MPEPASRSRPVKKVAPETARLARQLYLEGMPLVGIVRRTGLHIRAIYDWVDREVAEDGTVTLSPVPRRMAGLRGQGAVRRAGRLDGGADGMARRKAAHAQITNMVGPEDDVFVDSPTGGVVTGNGSEAMADDPNAATEAVEARPTPRRPALLARARMDGPPRQRLLARLWRTAERQVVEIETRMKVASVSEDPDRAPRTPADSEKDARALALIARTLRELAAAEDEAAGISGKRQDDDGARDLDDFRRELARRLEQLRADGDDGAALSGEPE